MHIRLHVLVNEKARTRRWFLRDEHFRGLLFLLFFSLSSSVIRGDLLHVNYV